MRPQRTPRLKDNLNDLLQDRGLSLNQVAKRTNINKSSLHNYANGVLPQGLAALIKLADIFGISVDELLFGKAVPVEEVERYEVTVKKIAQTKD